MYLNKNFKLNKELRDNFEKQGFIVLKNFFSKKIINEINQKVNKLLNNKDNFYPPRDISFYKNKKSALRNPNGTLKIALNELVIDRGYKYFSKFTNGVSFRDPLFKIDKLQFLVFQKKLIKLMDFLFDEKCFIGSLKLASFFSNKLPKNCINFFHTDELTYNGKKNPKAYKISIALNLKNNSKNHYMHLPINKKKLPFKNQYFEKKNLNKSLRKKIVSPRIEIGDIIVFDPSNFYHAANKPVNIVRNIFYIEFVTDIKKKSNLKIKTKKFLHLTNAQKKLSYFSKV